MSEIRFFFDENMNPAIADQLIRNGIDVITVRDLGELGDSDANHLQKAAEMGRVLCTHDTDFLRLNAEGIEHAGIVFVPQYQTSVGAIVKALRELHTGKTAEEMKGQVKFLNVKS